MAVPAIETPPRRPLRVFAFDPMFGKGKLNVITIDLENEELLPGPAGNRIVVVDYDVERKTYYPPVDLDDPVVLMQSGLAPSEADPRFHQQMVYAVALKVLENFDRALGRRIRFKQGPLRLFPHALRQANAFYDSNLDAVLFGYFAARRDSPGENLPGQTVFTCLSQDIIAHEVTHAVVNRLREYFLEPSNEDVLAFHEGFADIVAIFQHFTFPDVLADAIARTRGELHSPSTLVSLATQFGHATGRDGALRTALDQPDPLRYAKAAEPHERGSILVAAVFEAFFAIYQARIRGLIRIATSGSGVLPVGELHPELVRALAAEASTAAQEVLTMCIRAFEYLPPVDVTFGDYLRALITADYDLAGDSNIDGRRAMIEAFRRRGIYPEGVMSLSEDSLRWPPAPATKGPFPGEAIATGLVTGAKAFRPRGEVEAPPGRSADPSFHELRQWLEANRSALSLARNAKIKLDAFHANYRVKPDGELVIEIVAQCTQKMDTTGDPRFGGLPIRGGTTIVAAADGTVRFAIAKPLSPQRKQRQIEFVERRDLSDPMAAWGSGSRYELRARASLQHLHAGLVG
jgi:hypothetical protein